MTLIISGMISTAIMRKWDQGIQYTYAIFFSESVNLVVSCGTNVKWSTRIFVGFWTVYSMIIIMAYSSVLKSSLISPTYYPILRSFEEVLEKPDLRIGIMDETNYEYKYLQV